MLSFLLWQSLTNLTTPARGNGEDFNIPEYCQVILWRNAIFVIANYRSGISKCRRRQQSNSSNPKGSY
jgi:hypothetical protein